tara:strand:- start:1026 stop:1325 length:300 start_codon:yes stop_codon:yes gene_type:complete
MRFFDVLKKRKILFLNIFLFLYIVTNLFTGERGLMSYFEKREIEKYLNENKASLALEIKEIEKKNLLLSENLNFDFIDILIREKLKFGNKDEVIIKLND